MRQPPPGTLAQNPLTALLPAILIVLFLLGCGWVWFFCRIEPPNGRIAVLTRKTGTDLPPEQILATQPDQKGIQLATLPEGRYFRNPFVWDWAIVKQTDIPAGKFGVLVRRYGKNPQDGGIIATNEDEKGIVREVLGTGKHRINPYAYDVILCDDIKIDPGYVGVVTSQIGRDILNDPTPPAPIEQGFLVAPGSKGVQAAVLKEGTHRLNPYIYAVSLVNIQSQRYEFSGEDAIRFLTSDAFPITVEGTIEFNLSPDKAARLTQEVGDMKDIMEKLILPSARGFFRIEGSKNDATEFIFGESRRVFQDNLEQYLKKTCERWGISLNSVLIRDIIPPQEIAQIIRDRELAGQESRRIEQQIIQAQSMAELEKQKMLAEQNQRKVAAETDQIQKKIAAEQRKSEQTIAAQAQLNVEAIRLKAAEADAQAQITAAEADRSVVAAQNQAKAETLRTEIVAHGSDANYIRARLYEITAPKIQSILTTDANSALLNLPAAK